MITVFPQATKNYNVEVNAGRVYGVTAVNKYGHATDCDSAVPTDVWGGADGVTSTDIWVPPTAARVHQIVSSSIADDAAGTGARTIRVTYLPDWDTEEVSVDLDLDGTTNVATPSLVMINRMECLTWGTGGLNAGIIKATADTDATITAVIQAGDNQTQQCIYGIPSTKNLFLNYAACGIFGGTGLASTLTGQLLYMRDPATNAAGNLAWTVKEEIDDEEGRPPWEHTYKPQKKFVGPGIIKIQIVSSVNNSQATAVLDGYLVDQ